MHLRRERLRKLNLFLIFFFGISLFVLFLLNGGAYARDMRYALFLRSPLATDDLKEGDILQVGLVPGAPVATPSGGKYAYRLSIPKIEVSVPVILPRENTKTSILASLEEGVGLYPASALPGTPDARSVILGHSSRASWYRGEYATIFALLPRLEELDEFYITGNGKKYTYRVFSKKILTPSDTNAILAGPSSGSEIDLITCYPIGSASKRTLIRASLVSVEEI